MDSDSTAGCFLGQICDIEKNTFLSKRLVTYMFMTTGLKHEKDYNGLHTFALHTFILGYKKNTFLVKQKC